jgi:hypothetical protein
LKNKTISVNFFAGPGTGKSTVAAAVFSALKSDDINCELVTEYAKRKVWEEAYKVFECQMYVCAKQIYSMFVVGKHVDVIVTDSPLVLSVAYNDDEDGLLDQILMKEHRKYHNINIFLKRTKKYNPKGRMQTEDEAKTIDENVKGILEDKDLDYVELVSSKENIENIVTHIKQKIEEYNSEFQKETI